MPKIGDIVPLSVQLFDGDETKFVKGVVRDSSETEVSGSPFALTHVSDGRYENSSLVMPSTAFLGATYIIFNDALFTSVSPDHSIATDVFPLEVPDAEILDKLIEIKTLLDQLSTERLPTRLSGTIDEVTKLVGEIQDILTISGSIDEDTKLIAEISTVDKLSGEIDEIEIKGDLS